MRIIRFVKEKLDRDFYFAVLSYSKTDGFIPFISGGFLIGSTIGCFLLSLIILLLYYLQIKTNIRTISIVVLVLSCVFPLFIYTEKYHEHIKNKYKDKKNKLVYCIWVYIKLFLSIAFLYFVIFNHGGNLN
jgi:uncharacterized membrane protein YjjP (DUF1212 family)